MKIMDKMDEMDKIRYNHSTMYKKILRTNFTDWILLADFLQLNDVDRQQILIKPKFPLNLPLRLAEKIEKGTLHDPILKQFLPTVGELQIIDNFVTDPVDDLASQQTGKLLHKYHGRVLLVCTSACAMHCRYCFRQNFDYEISDKSFEQELHYIANDKTIREVILSGGDPLSLPNQILDSLLLKISEIDHVKKIRFHTRFPIGIPERIDDEFLAILEKSPQQIWFVIHCNHPRELDDVIFSRLRSLQKLGIVVMNQAVLLKGVNDDVGVLKELCESLSDRGILPYYLHQLDRVQGAQHFEVNGHQIVEELKSLLPGYAVPKYVKEVPGERSKTTLI